jgi:hypothetical protein
MHRPLPNLGTVSLGSRRYLCHGDFYRISQYVILHITAHRHTCTDTRGGGGLVGGNIVQGVVYEKTAA